MPDFTNKTLERLYNVLAVCNTWMSRRDIAAVLDRKTLSQNDFIYLRKLESSGFIETRKVQLGTSKCPTIQYHVKG